MEETEMELVLGSGQILLLNTSMTPTVHVYAAWARGAAVE